MIMPPNMRYLSVSEKVVLCGQRVSAEPMMPALDLILSAPKPPTKKWACHLSCPDRDIFHGSPCKYYNLGDENSGLL